MDRYTTIRFVMSIVSILGWKLHQMDVNTSFLNGEVEEEVYMKQHEGFVVHGNESHVFKLKKALYGIKKAPRDGYSKINIYL